MSVSCSQFIVDYIFGSSIVHVCIETISKKLYCKEDIIFRLNPKNKQFHTGKQPHRNGTLVRPLTNTLLGI